ncbi:WD repeat-containing protein 90 isoform X2 [Colius striatus]|uniref:WD repeat-containing protein 90 isoform X2 n=1 Tax=Colius striatus TaxID=57412 RepID=UPI002B1DB40B|nr:WD repeat-containing protein 90 isoform X2 [Colius striatus]
MAAGSGRGPSGHGAWQRPYLNIFKHFRVEEWKRSARDGDVAAVTVTEAVARQGGGQRHHGQAALTPPSPFRKDARLKGSVYRIRGSVPGSSYLQLPRTPTQSLGLTGRYLYVLFRPVAHKHFLVHLDVSTQENQVVRVSFSSLFKEFKSTATWLQFPFVCGAARRDALGAAPADVRWTCLVLDLRSILSLYLSRRYSHLKSIKLCSSLLVKTLCTSDLLFDPGVTPGHRPRRGLSAMPREMAFPVPRGEQWHQLYDYIRFPSEGSSVLVDSIQKSCASPAAGGQSPADPGCQLPQPGALAKALRDRLSLVHQITSPEAVPRRCPVVMRHIPEVQLPAPGPLRAVAAAGQEKEQRPPSVADVAQAAAVADGDGGIHVYAAPRSRRCPQTVPSASQGRLLPDPILRLRTIIGFGGCSTRWVLWTQDSSVVVYPCHAVIVALQIHTGEQRFFMGHTDKVSALAMDSSSTVLASVQAGPRAVLRLWDFPTGSCLSVFKTQAQSLFSLSFSRDGAVLCGVGRDGHGKTMVVVWNTAQVTHGGEVAVLAKAHTDVDIQALKIAFFDDTRMVSCGRASVRLWRLRAGFLRSCPVALGEFQSLHFTDLTLEEPQAAARDRPGHTLFVCSRSGHVLELDYENVCVRSVRRLLPTQPQHCPGQEQPGNGAGPGIAINSISISSAFCATGSEDGYLRLWPRDFSAVVLEAEHEAPLSCVCISPDGRRVLCSTAAGSLGCLDIPSWGYSTLMRSHGGSVLAFSTEGLRKQMATVSRDNSVRVWDLSSMQQLYDFTAADESPCAVAFHPAQHLLACGFDSGTVRIFDLASSDLLVEHKQHHTVITGLTFSPDGKFMFSSCLQGTLALYSCTEQRSHVLRVLGNVVAAAGGSGSEALAVSGDSRLLAFVGPSRAVVSVLQACSLHQLLRVDISVLDTNCTALGCSARVCFAPVPRGELLVATSASKLLVLDTRTGRLVREVSGVHKLCCSSLALSRDGRYLLTAGDKVIKVWDYQMRFDVNFQVYIGHSEPVCQVAFSPDQQHVLSVGDAIFLWDFLAPPEGASVPALLPGAEDRGQLAPPARGSWSNKHGEGSSGKLKDACESPEQPVPVPPCRGVSAVRPAACPGVFSELDPEEEADVPGSSRIGAKGDKDASVPVVELLTNEELLVVRPKVRQESSRSPGGPAKELREDSQSAESPCPIRPDCYRHFTPRFRASLLPQSFLPAPAGSEVLELKAVIGYNGNGRGNMVWHPDTGFFAYTCGCIIVVEDLHSGSQSHWLGHAEEISALAVSHDAQVLASASGRRNGDSRCQICIWNIQDGVCTANLFHHQTQVQAMAFSRDDRFLVTLGDYSDQSLALWDTSTHQLLASTALSQPAHDVAFSPFSHRELACVGKGAVMFWLLEQQGADVSLKVHQAPAPAVLGPVELTSVCYGADALLYSGTNSGHVCVWDTQQNRCFMTWEADEGEIGVLVCGHHRLLSGSNTKRIRLWAVAAVPELRLRGPDARSSSVLLEHEMPLDGTIVSAAFDESLEMGIVGTTAGTLWYINWAESTSIRLISGHKNKVTAVGFSPDETHCATCGEDGSVRVWSLGSMELVVQFQVLNQSCQCLAWKPHAAAARGAESQHVVAGYSDGTIRLFSVSRTEMELKMHPHSTALTAITFSTDGEMILSGSKDGLVAVSSPRTGITLCVLAEHRGCAITVLHCTSKQYHALGVEGGELWLATSSDRRVSVWASDWLKDKCELLDWLSFPAPAGPQEGLSSLPPSLAAFCPWEPGTLVYVGFGLQKEALFYSLHKKQVLRKLSLPYFATSLSLCPAAPFMAVGFGERLLRLLRCPAGAAQDYAGHDDTVQLCCFGPSGRRLLTASHSALFVWELAGA